LPNPTLAQEIRDIQREVEPQKVTLHVARIEFNKSGAIPAEIQNEIRRKVEHSTYEEDADSDYLREAADEIAEVGVRGPLQNRGYFKAQSNAVMTEIQKDSHEVSVAVNISAEPGPQYRVGKIEIKAADPDKWLSLRPQALRKELRLGEGEILNLDAIRGALRKLTRIYGEFGFIDMTAAPDFTIDETQKTIDLTIRVDEQKQYYVNEVQFLGADQKLEEKLKAAFPSSMWLFDSGRLEDFFKNNKNILPSNVSLDDMELHRNTKAGEVSIVFDFRPCPGRAK